VKKEFLGQPVWLWAAGAAVIVGGYLYLRHKQSTAASTQSSTGAGTGGRQGTATGGGSYSLQEWIVQHQASPPKPKRRPRVPGPLHG
jgi:hypothetical protein